MITDISDDVDTLLNNDEEVTPKSKPATKKRRPATKLVDKPKLSKKVNKNVDDEMHDKEIAIGISSSDPSNEEKSDEKPKKKRKRGLTKAEVVTQLGESTRDFVALHTEFAELKSNFSSANATIAQQTLKLQFLQQRVKELEGVNAQLAYVAKFVNANQAAPSKS